MPIVLVLLQATSDQGKAFDTAAELRTLETRVAARYTSTATGTAKADAVVRNGQYYCLKLKYFSTVLCYSVVCVNLC
jgi:hypothetical protein